MIKLRGDRNGRPFIMLGLSRLNCDRLLDDKPIVIFGPEIGIDFDITIIGGETEATMVEQLKAAGIELPQAKSSVERQ